MTLSLFLLRGRYRDRGEDEIREDLPALKTWQLLPASSAKPQPACIPEPLLADYDEACAIRDLSPKASATLSRRCLQGMIRDFAGISRKTLHQEIEALRKAVDNGESNVRDVSHESIDAIDAIREVGNIGAHMEADINHIVDVDPDEAQELIGLIELLFDEWYVQREARQTRFARLIELGKEKKAAKLPAPPKQIEQKQKS